MVTDGITEARHNGEFLGYDGLTRLADEARRLGSLGEMARGILDGARAFADGKLHDDACLVLAQRL
jgi:serine phosphatase RsbU (regulator of sigma subunit)